MGAGSLSNLAGGIGVAEVKWGQGWGSKWLSQEGDEAGWSKYVR